jgi:hypothetical protein
MKYSDGSPVLLGDKVDLGGAMTGVVVAVIDADFFSDEYPANEWSYLLTGVLIESLEAGLIYREKIEHDFDLIARK